MSQKHFVLTLDVKLNFGKHVKNIPQKVSKTWTYCVDFNQS